MSGRFTDDSALSPVPFYHRQRVWETRSAAECNRWLTLVNPTLLPNTLGAHAGALLVLNLPEGLKIVDAKSQRAVDCLHSSTLMFA